MWQESFLAINPIEIEEIRINNTINAPVFIGDKQIKRTSKTFYLGPMIADFGGTQGDTIARVGY